MRHPALLLVPLVLAASAWGENPLETEADKRAERSLVREKDGPVLKGLRIHEWGVFLTGKKETRASAGGEPPTFVQRVEMPGKPEVPAGGREADKPVLHIYAPKPVDLVVRVDFPGGMPELAWPKGTPGWRRCAEGEIAPGLSWTLRVGGDGEPQPPRVPDGHWIAACRKPGSDLVRSGRDAERFLFYEGKVGTSRAHVSLTRLKEGCLLSSEGIDEAWLLEASDGNLACLHEGGLVCPPGVERARALRAPAPIGPDALRASLDKALTAAGLSTAESAAVLDIWMPELTKPGIRLVYILPRAEYDRLLPITFDPAPEELKRVGLVIQEE